jgi:hypothetical protein
MTKVFDPIDCNGNRKPTKPPTSLSQIVRATSFRRQTRLYSLPCTELPSAQITQKIFSVIAANSKMMPRPFATAIRPNCRLPSHAGCVLHSLTHSALNRKSLRKSPTRWRRALRRGAELSAHRSVDAHIFVLACHN